MYEITAIMLSDDVIKIDVSDYGLAKVREDGNLSLLDNENKFMLKKGEDLVLRTQTTDYGEEIKIRWD